MMSIWDDDPLTYSEVILTMGHSKTVEVFLKQAHKDRKFTVIVAESAPSSVTTSIPKFLLTSRFLGHTLAANLTSAGITTILIPDSSIHAVMSRCTKVIIGAHSVLANGGVYSLCGSLAAALAARAYAKPVVVLSGQFKFAPAWNSYHEFSAVDYQGPQNVLGHHGANGSVEVVDPYYDYIRPDLVNLFVTNE
jgi:translation initiation factor eIF-2B subunit beta